MTTATRGMFALSGDPLTYGHLDVIRRALKECDELVVLIANNGGKAGRYLFTLSERVAIAERAVRECGLAGQVRVTSSDGLLFDEFLKEDCSLLFRGIRNNVDRAYEEEQLGLMRLFTNALPPERVRYIEATSELAAVSSSMVKAAVAAGLDVERFVPLFVKALLEERILGQYKIGITGEMASGKTYVARSLAETLTARGIPALVVNFDELQRTLYREASSAGTKIRQNLSERFGTSVLTDDQQDVRRDVLKTKIFAAETTAVMRAELHQLVAPHIFRLYREAIRNHRGIIILEWAQLAEGNLGHLVNNNVIVVEADSESREAFAAKRNLSTADRLAVKKHQLSANEKIALLSKQIEQDSFGQVFHYHNQVGNNASITELAHEVANLFHLTIKE